MKTPSRMIVIAVAVGMSIAPAASAVSPLLKEIEDAFIELSEQVGPSVVEISAETRGDDSRVNELFRFFGRPEGEEDDEENGEEDSQPPRQRRTPTATGSGFLFDKNGHIITNNHVVEKATKLTVALWDGSEHEAEVIGTDPDTDLAVIKIAPNGRDLPVATIGSSDNLKVGQFAVAMGSPRGLTGSISFGHISGLGRERLNLPDENLRFQSFIQTDAAINLGNSGGPLCDIEGNVIGVNIAIVWGANSIGFAIPIDRVKQIVPEIIKSGKVVRGWLGVTIMDVAAAAEEAGQEVDDFLQAYNLPGEEGAYVRGVTWGGPAEKAELKEEDVIWKIEGAVVSNTLDLIERISAVEPGTSVDLDVWREGELIEMPVIISEFPGMDGAKYGQNLLGMHVMDLGEINLTAGFAERLGLDDITTGVIIAAVEPDSPAEDEGIQPGDIVLKVAHEDVGDKNDFRRLISEKAEAGKALLLHVKRAGEEDLVRKFIKVPEDFQPNGN